MVGDAGSVENRTAHYPGYHELAYLHPNHFMADVDMPYFEKIMDSVDKDQVQWEIYYHTDRDIKNINHFCKRFGVSAQTTYLLRA